MILEKFKIETKNGISEEFKNEFKEKISKLNFSKVASVNTIITCNNENINLSELSEIGILMCESVDKNMRVNMETNQDKNYSDTNFKIEFLTSDIENEWNKKIGF